MKRRTAVSPGSRERRPAVGRLARGLQMVGLSILLSAGLAQAADTVKISTNYYKVFGSTLREVRESINRSRPWKDKDAMDGRTDWSVRSRYSVADDGSGSRGESFGTETRITITLPVWSPLPNTPKAMTDRWREYFTALLRHENGHATHALQAAAEVRKRAGVITRAPTNDELTKKINDTVNRVLSEYQEKEKAYDKETRHGVTQGATFP
jgi:predicted secreted Zn-dependent protease